MLTSAGTSTALGVIKGLSDNDYFEICTTDVNPYEMLALGAFNIVSHHIVPYASRGQEFVERIDNLVEELSIDHIYPIHDEEIRTLHGSSLERIVERLSSLNINSIKKCTNKLVAHQICVEYSINTPRTSEVSTFLEKPFFPVFVKPKIGVGSIGARLVKSHSDLFDSDGDLVVQDVCEGPEVTVDCLTWEGSTIAVARERIEIKSGVSTKARIFFSNELQIIAKALADRFELVGMFCFQVMRYNNEWAVIDINPRSGGASAMLLACGINFYQEHFLIQAGLCDKSRFDALAVKVSQLSASNVVRYYSEHRIELGSQND
ncbi:ATP-grasp domain-containing protein [Methylorubrum extorquens]|uniref:ATP-grasp domain-containing protein n=1 Tax=Methylorubrum extorquens TaxID=408 RepID=UPI0013016BBE|nr:ATP-grasp domain-containing protein [Methylorubrum extorquens]